jgi:thiol-disulfide isomerase/thioredoxin
MAIGLTVVAAEDDAAKLIVDKAEDDAAKLIADKSDDGAAQMIAAIEALKSPVLDSSRVKDPDYARAFMNEKKVYNDKRGELVREFYRKFPDHPQALKYLSQNWQALASSGHADAALAEIDQMLADHPTVARRTNLLYFRAITLVSSRSRSGSMTEATKTATVGNMTSTTKTATTGSMTAAAKTAAATAIDEFIKEFPKDKRGGELLLHMVDADRDSPHEAEILKRIVENYGDTMSGAVAKGKLRQHEGIGRPVELNFTDAISGKPISMGDLKGKIVVLDFWATWFGPYVDEMPKMKKLYAEYKDKGVEFIGISLDNPPDGLAKLKDFVAKNDIPWLQYYQGEGIRSAFSSGWGINSLPCAFVVDAAGNLYSTEAHGKVATIISTLLAKR